MAARTYVQRALQAGERLPARAGAILSYWFGQDAHWPLLPVDAKPQAEEACAQAYFANCNDQYPLWFAGGKEVDAAITTQFGPDLQRLDQDKQAYDAWFTDDMNPRAGLAAIILTDQMSRNIFRGCSECFQYDRFARDWTHRLLDSGRYRELRPVELSFALMPLEHSEDLKHHRRHAEMLDQAIAECQSHGSEAAKAMSKSLINFKKFLADHSQVVEQFGRYPHRNKVLGRTNTPEEETYLKDGGASWGQ